MQRHITLVLLLVLTFACREDAPNQTCLVKNPVENLDWLMVAIDDMSKSSLSQYQYVMQATYKSQTVFIFGNCCPFCNTITPVYNCSGDRLGYIGTGSNDIDANLLDQDVVIWKPDNSACNF